MTPHYQHEPSAAEFVAAPGERRDADLPKSNDNGRASVADVIAFVESFGERMYPRDVFLPVPHEAKARDAVAADLMREMMPRVAAALRGEFEAGARAATPPKAGPALKEALGNTLKMWTSYTQQATRDVLCVLVDFRLIAREDRE